MNNTHPKYRFSFGPWNIHEGADPFGPPTRNTIAFADKLSEYRRLGFEGIQLHDDDAVPNLNDHSAAEIASKAGELKRVLDGEGLIPEFVAPRLWEDPLTIDGAYTSNDPAAREYARKRSRQCIDIARALDCRLIVLWLAREGTYIREAKDSKAAVDRLAEAVEDMLAYDPDIRIAIEPKPNEPVDQAYIPTTGHAVALAYRTQAPERVGVVIESAHAILAGLDPSDEMGFALAYGKLFSVHLNDQNGLKFDEDKAFGAVDLRRAFNQVRILEKHGYGKHGEFVGLDVKALRTQKAESATRHLSNSREIFLGLVDIVRALDENHIDSHIQNRDYEALEFLIIQSLMGGRLAME